MRTIALYNREGKRLLTLKQAAAKGYGSNEMLKKRIRRQQLPACKLGSLWLIMEDTFPYRSRRRSPRKSHKRPGPDH